MTINFVSFVNPRLYVIGQSKQIYTIGSLRRQLHYDVWPNFHSTIIQGRKIQYVRRHSVECPFWPERSPIPRKQLVDVLLFVFLSPPRAGFARKFSQWICVCFRHHTQLFINLISLCKKPTCSSFFFPPADESPPPTPAIA